MTEKSLLPRSQDSLEHGQLRRLEILSMIEATTLVLLVCIAVPAKHLYGWPAATRALGPIHGIAFMLYIWTALQTVSGGGWTRRDMARLFVVAIIPFGGFLNFAWLRRRIKILNDGGHKQP